MIGHSNIYRRDRMKIFNIGKEFVVLSPEKVACTVVNSPQVYEELERDFPGFKGHDLIAMHEFQEDWPSWEVHPNGDEIVVLLSGSATFMLKIDNVNHQLTLNGFGDSVVVPKNVWHTAKIDDSAKMLFVTPGEGTLNEYDQTKLD